jgi:type VI secretion system protein VasG
LKQGEFRIIIATTWPKYQQYLEKEAVFTRWFEVIKIEEPPVERGIMMLRCLAPGLEKYHKVQILNEAIEAAVTLSKRFLPQRQLPEKAINLLDTACARVCVTQESTPPVIQELNNTLQLLQIEASMLQRETRQSSRYAERLRDLSDQIHLTKLSLNNAEAIWQQIKILKDQIKSLNHHVLQLESVDDSLMSELNQLEESARKLSQELNLSLVVDQDCIAQVLSSWTGIPTTTILSLQKEVNFESIFSHLKSKIIGQDQAPTQLSQAVLMSQEGLPDPTPPQASSF